MRTVAPQLWISACWVVTFGGLIATARMISPSSQASWQSKPHDRSLDPKLGQPLPTALLSALPDGTLTRGKSREPAGGERPDQVLIVAGGPCSECSLNQFDPRELSIQGYGRVVVVYLAGPSEVEKLGTPPAGLEFVADTDGTVHRALNASWSPRFYIADGRGNLSWIQTLPGQRLGTNEGRLVQGERRQ